MVCFQGRSIVPRPKSGYSWSCQVPRAPLHDRGVTSLIVVSRTTSAGVTLRHRSYGLMRQSSTLPLPTVSPLVNGSVPVAVSPGWVEDRRVGRGSFPLGPSQIPYVSLSTHTARAIPSACQLCGLMGSSHRWLTSRVRGMTRPLRSISITETSLLLRGGPPLSLASVLSRSQGPPGCVSPFASRARRVDRRNFTSSPPQIRT